MLEIKYSASQVAKTFEVEPKVFRKFLRQVFEGVGQGGRYEFTMEQVEAMRPKFAEWNSKKSKKSGDSVPAPRRQRQSAKDTESPLEAKPRVVGVESIRQRNERLGLVCIHSLTLKTGTVVDRCDQEPVKGEKYCDKHLELHTQQYFCGDVDKPKCGGNTGRPDCKYHAGDISEEEFDEWLTKQEKSAS